MAKPEKAQLTSPEVVFPEEQQPQSAPAAAVPQSPAPPPTIDGLVVEQIATACRKSGDQLAALEAQTALAREAHNKNLGMALLMEQLRGQGLTLLQIPRQ